MGTGLLDSFMEGYTGGKQAMQEQKLRDLKLQEAQRKLEQQQALQDAAQQAQEQATTEPHPYSGQQAMQGTTTVTSPHDYSGQGTDMSIANAYPNGQAMEQGLQDQTVSQAPSTAFQIPDQQVQGLQDQTEFNYPEYIQSLTNHVAQTDPQAAEHLHQVLRKAHDENFKDFARSVFLGDPRRAEQEFNQTGQFQIQPGSLEIQPDQNQVTFQDSEGQPHAMGLDTIQQMAGIKQPDPFDVAPGHDLVDKNGHRIYHNAKSKSEDRPSTSLYNAASRALGQAIGGDFQNGVFTGTTPGKTMWFMRAQKIAHDLIDQGANPGEAAIQAYTQTRKEVPNVNGWEDQARQQAEHQLQQESNNQAWNQGFWPWVGYKLDPWAGPSEKEIQQRQRSILHQQHPGYQGGIMNQPAPTGTPQENGGDHPGHSGTAGQKTNESGGDVSRVDPSKVGDPVDDPGSRVRQIPQKAQEILRQNPSDTTRAYFNKHYGQGMAEYVLQHQE